MANRRITLLGIIGGAVVVLGGGLALALGHNQPHTVTVPVAHKHKGHLSGAVLPTHVSATSAPVMMPVSGKIESAFGWQYSGALNEWYYNPGITISAKSGTKVRAAWAGRVTKVSSMPHMGKTVDVVDGNGFSTLYGHMGNVSIKAGQSVKQGQVMGTVGGASMYSRQSGSHLDFQIYHGKTASDPMSYLHPSS